MRAVAPAIYITVLLSSGGRARGVVVKGIDPALEAKRNEALQRIVAGAADFAPDSRRIRLPWSSGKCWPTNWNCRPAIT